MLAAICRQESSTRRFAFGVAFLLLTLYSAAALEAGDYAKLTKSDLETLQESFADLAENAMPSCVAIRTYISSRTNRGGERVMRPFSQGAGVIYRSDGYILTNHHVIEDAPIIIVVLNNGDEYEADVVQSDRRSDLAVIKIDAVRLPAARFGGFREVRVGHWVFAVGNPFGLANLRGRSTFTVGNVSALGRAMTNQIDRSQRRYYGNLIETSAAINPGNSGGPLFNLDGEIIGIVAAIETRSGANEGMGFAIPLTDRNLAIIEKLERGEEIRYGYLAVEIDTGPVREAQEFTGRRQLGALIVRISAPDGPAARAGLRVDDLIVQFDGTTIEDSDHLVRLVGATPVGSRVKVRFRRGGKQRTAYVVLADRETMLASGQGNGVEPETVLTWRGLVLAERPTTSRRNSRNGSSATRLMVIDIEEGSDAGGKRLRLNDEVVAVNGSRVRTLQDFVDAVAKADKAISLRLKSNRIITFPPINRTTAP